MSNLLAMGGYAAYVWPAYGVAVLGLAGITFASWWTLRRRRLALASRDRK